MDSSKFDALANAIEEKHGTSFLCRVMLSTINKILIEKGIVEPTELLKKFATTAQTEIQKSKIVE
jgi:hypothetical protein